MLAPKKKRARKKRKISDRELFQRFEEGFDMFNDDAYREYWGALGKFIHVLARTEHRLLRLLRKHARVTDAVAGILFSGTRLNEAKDLLNSILETKGRTHLKGWLERPLEHLKSLNTVRNQLVHWGARSDGTAALLVSNALLTPPKSKRKKFRIEAAEMEKICKDLYRIDFMLTLALDDEDPDEGIVANLMPKPWLYKPPQLSPPKKSLRPRTPDKK